MTKDRSVYIRHIYDCIRRIKDYTQDGKEAFFQDPKTQDAVIRNLEIIGQAVKDFGTEKLVSSNPQVGCICSRCCGACVGNCSYL